MYGFTDILEKKMKAQRVMFTEDDRLIDLLFCLLQRQG